MADLVLGPSGGSGGHEFEGYVLPLGARLREIRVNAGVYVDGIQFVCIDADGATTQLPHIGGRGGTHHTVTLDADEYLVGISGHSGRYVDSIRFHTNKRTTESYGGLGGDEEFNYQTADNREVAGLIGGGGWLIDRLGVILRDHVWVESAPQATANVTASVTDAAAPAPTAAAKGRKKSAPAAELVALPDSPPVAPADPDLVAIPDAEPVAPHDPALVAIPNSEPVVAQKAEFVAIPDSPPLDEDAGAQRDDLTKIEGIGPKVAQLLADAGITSFAALAAVPVAHLRDLLSAAGSRYRLIDPATWPEQAALAAQGDWAAFKALVAELKAGKRIS